MNCPYCGAALNSGTRFCTNCGSAIARSEERSSESSSASRPPYTINTVVMPSGEVPQQYRPLSPWAYFGYSLLFAIPVLGFIFNLIYCFSDDNINRRNFARSIWCGALISLILVAVMFVFALATGSLAYLADSF